MNSDVLAMERRAPRGLPIAVDEQAASPPLRSRVITWALVVPLLFYAVSGVVRFDSSFKNNTLSSNFQSPQETDVRTRILNLGVTLECAVLALSRWKSVKTLLVANRALVALWALAFISVAWSVSPHPTLTYSSYLAVNTLFAAFLIARFDKQEQMQLMMLIGWLATFLSIAAAILVPAYGVDHRGVHSSGDWMGIYIHKNSCAVVTTYLLSAAFFYQVKGIYARMYRAIYICGSIFLLIMTQARTGWLAFAILACFALCYKLYRKISHRERILLMLVVIAVAVTAALVLANNYVALLQGLGKDATLTGRTEIFTAVFNAILKHSITGYGYFAYFSSPDNYETSLQSGVRGLLPTVDNGYLGLWLDLGIVGLLLFSATLLRALYDAYICLKRGRHVGWYVSILILAIVTNTAERMIMLPNYLAWILYMMACLGLRQEVLKSRDQEAA
jgi:exopolysaccharide production protein ExoQ